MEHNKHKLIKIRMEFSHIHTVITSDDLERNLKIKKNCNIPKIIVIQSYASTTRRVRTEITTIFK